MSHVVESRAGRPAVETSYEWSCEFAIAVQTPCVLKSQNDWRQRDIWSVLSVERCRERPQNIEETARRPFQAELDEVAGVETVVRSRQCAQPSPGLDLPQIQGQRHAVSLLHFPQKEAH